jgi:hypothetical protein
MSTFTISDYHLARENGGFSYQPTVETRDQGAVRCALSIARDLLAYRQDQSAYVEWNPSAFDWDGDFPMAENTVLLDAVLYVGDEIVASLASVNVYSESDSYCRIIEAELYGEWRHETRAQDLRTAIYCYCEV